MPLVQKLDHMCGPSTPVLNVTMLLDHCTEEPSHDGNDVKASACVPTVKVPLVISAVPFLSVGPLPDLSPNSPCSG